MPSAGCAGSVRPLKTTSSVKSAGAPSRQDRLRHLMDASVDGAPVEHCGRNADGGAEAGDGVDEMVGEGLHIPVTTGCGTVEVILADRLDDVVHQYQCLVGTGEFVHGLSVRSLDRRQGGEACRQVGVGDERFAVCDEIGEPVGDELVSRSRVIPTLAMRVPRSRARKWLNMPSPCRPDSGPPLSSAIAPINNQCANG
jgi:hypothetical protein